MEAAPSVSFHERAPDLMQEEDLQNSQLEAEESATRLQGSHWQQPRDTKEGLPAERAGRADLSYGFPFGRGGKTEGPFGCSTGMADRGRTSHLPLNVPMSASVNGNNPAPRSCQPAALLTLHTMYIHVMIQKLAFLDSPASFLAAVLGMQVKDFPSGLAAAICSLQTARHLHVLCLGFAVLCCSNVVWFAL